MILAIIHALALVCEVACPISRPLAHEQKEVKAISNRKRQSHQP